MTFNANEASVESGRPLKLYEFVFGSAVWRYTNADRTVSYGGNDYASMAISDDGRRLSGEPGADEFVITVPANHPLVPLFRITAPASDVRVTVREMHYGDSDARIYFPGVIQSVRRPGIAKAEFVCLSNMSSLGRPGLRLGYSRNCPYVVYDTLCKVNPTPFGVAGAVSAKTGTTIIAAAWNSGDTRYALGFVQWIRVDGQTDRRTIEAQAGGVLTLLGGTDGIVVGTSVTAYPGCARTIAVCASRFNNVVNYGGFPAMPGKSPFDGNPIS